MHGRSALRFGAGVVLVLALTACSKKEAAKPTAEESAAPAAPAATQPAAQQAAAGAIPAGMKQACELVPAEKLRELIGSDPGAAHPMDGACMYDSGLNIQVNVPATFDEARKTNEKVAGGVTEVAGLGDKAFLTNLGPTTDLHVVTGDIYLNVVIVKDMPQAKRTEMARAVMQELVKAAGR